MPKKDESVFEQVSDRGSVFSVVFYLFFVMSFIPLVILFIISLVKDNLPGIALALVFAAVLSRDVQQRQLFKTTRDLAILNLTLWFLLGFFTLLLHFIQQASGIFLYLLLIPYAMISGYLVFFLFSHAEKHPWKILEGGIAVSTMIAVISAVNGAISGAIGIISETFIKQVFGDGYIAGLLQEANPIALSPHLAFFFVMIVFNFPFIRHYIRQEKSYRELWLYCIPLFTYLLLIVLWGAVKRLLL